MRRLFSSAAAVITGLVVWVLVTYAGAVVVLLATFGIPLGAEGRDPTAAEYAMLLFVGALGGFTGGRVATRFRNAHKAVAQLVVPAIIAATLVWGFSKETSNWPGWWGPALAVVSAAGASIASTSRAAQRNRTS